MNVIQKFSLLCEILFCTVVANFGLEEINSRPTSHKDLILQEIDYH